MMDVEFKAKALEQVSGFCDKGDWVYGALVSDQYHEAYPYCLR